MSDTPRTDAELLRILNDDTIDLNNEVDRMADFARQLERDIAKLIERLRERTESHLHASARDVQTIQQQSVLLDRLATALKDCKSRAMDKSIETHADDHAKGCVDDIWEWAESALAAYESTKSSNLPDPLAEAVKRMESVSANELERIYFATACKHDMEAVRARLIQAAKGEQP